MAIVVTLLTGLHIRSAEASTALGESKEVATGILVRKRLLMSICAGEYFIPTTGVLRYSNKAKYGS